MSLRDGNEEAANFRTRIPRPAPADPPASHAAAPTSRVTAADVKSAVAAAVRSTPQPRTTPRPSPLLPMVIILFPPVDTRPPPVPHATPTPSPPTRQPHPRVPATPTRPSLTMTRASPLAPARQARGGRDKENAGSGGSGGSGEKRKPLGPTASEPDAAPTRGAKAARGATPLPASSVSMSYGGAGGGGALRDTSGTATDFDAEYDAVMASKLATKDTKFDFKAQIAAAKDYFVRSKSLLKDLHKAVAGGAAAVQAAHAESVGAVRAAQDAAHDAARDRDDLQRSLDAARAEAVTTATRLADAVHREKITTKVGPATFRPRLQTHYEHSFQESNYILLRGEQHLSVRTLRLPRTTAGRWRRPARKWPSPPRRPPRWARSWRRCGTSWRAAPRRTGCCRSRPLPPSPPTPPRRTRWRSFSHRRRPFTRQGACSEQALERR